MGRLPVPTWSHTPHGGFGAVRSTPADGGCGTGSHPCTHKGVDLRGNPGDAVYAPEDGTLVMVVARDPGVELPRPWRGYGPGIVMLKGKSGRYHLLAHLEADDLRSRWAYAREPIASLLDPAKPLSQQTDKGFDLTDPFDRIPDADPLAVKEGTMVGRVSAARHTHWEVRKSMLGSAYNPATWANAFVWNHNPPTEAVPDVEAALKPEDSLVLVALVIAALALWPKRKR